MRAALVWVLGWHFLEAVVPAPVIGYVAGAAGVALVSAAIGVVLSVGNVGNVAMLYLLVILPTAIWFGWAPAVFASVAAFLVFDWWFILPLHTLTIGDAQEWIALALFLVVSIVTSRLAAAQRERADEAQRREREARALHALARLLNASDDLDAVLNAVCERLRVELHLAGCAILLPAQEDRGGPVRVRALAGVPPTPGERPAAEWIARAAPPVARADGRAGGAAHRWIRVRRPDRTGKPAPYRVTFVSLAAGDHTVGMLRLATAPRRPDWTPEEARLLDAASEQIGRTIERAWLRQAATEAEVLRQTEEVRQAVLAAVSHDLRTPLASIMASAESLDQPDIPWTDEERHGFVAAIRQESAHLTRLVEDLLDMSRIEAGRLTAERGWFPLEDLVEDVLARLEPRSAGHQVVVDLPETLPLISLDYVQIGQVLTNLVENALKYTPPGTTITIAAREDEDQGAVRVSVQDDGPGIPPAALPHLFEKFYRVGGGDRARVKGTGLGLSLVRGYVEAHGGTVRVESPPPGQSRGTVFTFWLPLPAD